MYIDRTFNNPTELVDFLNGAISSKPLTGAAYRSLFGLDGLTLIIYDGSSDITITFSDPTNAGLSPADILAQIRATNNALSVVKLRSYGESPQRPILVVDTEGFIVRGAGTANTILGFSGSDATVVEITTTDIIKITASISGGPRYDVIYHTT